jgi:hypothetical protein
MPVREPDAALRLQAVPAEKRLRGIEDILACNFKVGCCSQQMRVVGVDLMKSVVSGSRQVKGVSRSQEDESWKGPQSADHRGHNRLVERQPVPKAQGFVQIELAEDRFELCPR